MTDFKDITFTINSLDVKYRGYTWATSLIVNDIVNEKLAALAIAGIDMEDVLINETFVNTHFRAFDWFLIFKSCLVVLNGKEQDVKDGDGKVVGREVQKKITYADFEDMDLETGDVIKKKLLSTLNFAQMQINCIKFCAEFTQTLNSLLNKGKKESQESETTPQ